MSGIAYDLTKIKGVVLDIDGVLSPSTVPVDSSGYPERMCNVKDGFAIQYAAKAGLQLAIISGGQSARYPNRLQLLGVKDVYMGCADKLTVLRKWMKERGLAPEEVAFMGDDVPDLPCLREVGLSCAPADCAMDLLGNVTYISRFDGGRGCVRDLLEQVLRAQGLWLTIPNSHHW